MLDAGGVDGRSVVGGIILPEIEILRIDVVQREMVARGPLDVDPGRIGVAESVVETHLEDARVEKTAQFRVAKGSLR